MMAFYCVDREFSLTLDHRNESKCNSLGSFRVSDQLDLDSHLSAPIVSRTGLAVAGQAPADAHEGVH
jgi:hypothetical protein